MEYLLLIAILPSIILGTFIYKMDVIEKEPKLLLMMLFILGVISTIPIVIVENLLLTAFPVEVVDFSTKMVVAFFQSFLLAALVEESYKLAFTYFYTWKHKEFNHIYDAIVYAVFVSLGFATIENLLYVFEYGFAVGIWRAVLSVPGHAFFAISMGLFLGKAKQAELMGDNNLCFKNKVYSLLFPVILHGTFNFCLYMENYVVFGFYIVFMIVLYVVSIINVNRIAKMSVMLYNNVQQEVVTNSFCPKCGSSVNSNFCSKCGLKL